MLRLSLLLIGVILTGIGLFFLLSPGKNPSLPFLIWGPVLVLAVLCERWRYHRKEHDEVGDWQQTGERFEDPETGDTIEVQYRPSTGEQRYVKAQNGNSRVTCPEK